MSRIEAIARLSEQADAIRALGAAALTFSVRRPGTRTRGSDLDIFVDYDRSSRFNAFDLVGIKLLLEEERLSMPVDVTTRDGLHPMLRDDIERAAIKIFSDGTVLS